MSRMTFTFKGGTLGYNMDISQNLVPSRRTEEAEALLTPRVYQCRWKHFEISSISASVLFKLLNKFAGAHTDLVIG